MFGFININFNSIYTQLGIDFIKIFIYDYINDAYLTGLKAISQSAIVSEQIKFENIRGIGDVIYHY